ncbi:MAG: DNA polymerase I [Lachnospiraceae bacterium]|nr:DNA polymerase I [Lachnospiraceae bacterium]
MSGKIVLIDGHSILNRAFYGVPDLTNSEGLHTNAVYGFLNIMLKILDEEKPDYLTVAFDVKHPTFRHEMYADYKGTRKGMPEELIEQVPLIQEVLGSMGVRMVMKEGLEADDILGTIAKMAEKEGLDVSLVSGDRDLLQLATEKIMIRIPKTKRGGTEIEDYHTQDVVEKYGLTPPQIVDLKGLMGDSSDNIPGVPGIGEKTAVKILTAYPTVEDAYKNLEQVTPKRTHDLLEANRELAFLSKQLATIKTDCELAYTLEEAKLPELFNEESFVMIKRLEFKSLLKRFGQEQMQTMTQSLKVQTLSDQKEVTKFFTELLKQKPDTAGLAFLGDEWTSSGAKRKKTAKKARGQLSLVFDDSMDFTMAQEEETEKEYPFYGISVSYEKQGEVVTGCALVNDKLTGEFLLEQVHQLAQAVSHIALINWKNILHLSTPVQELDEKREAPLQEAFADETMEQREKLFHQVVDLEIAAYLINPLKDTYQADDLARDYLDMTLSSYAELFGKKTMQELMEQQEEGMLQTVLQYLGNLSFVSCLAFPILKKELEQQEMWDLFGEIEMPTAYFLYQMERQGVRADRQELLEMSDLLQGRVEELEKDIYALAGEEFNINSPKQLGVILFEKMKLPFAKKTKTGYSTSADILEKLKSEDPIIPLILEYRQVTKLKSTYADGLPVYIEKDHRIHGKFNQTITATGRISSTDPNLQNIPIRMELGRQLRKVFKPKEGCIFLDADYSQIELRVLAHLSGDPELIEAYRENQDIHRSTASKVFHTPFDQVTDLQRRNAKAVNFGIVYGISSFGLGQDLNVSRKEAEGYINQYFATYPAIKEYLDGLVDTAKKTGYACTMFGRKRPVPELNSSNFMQRSFGERIAMNSPIQGTAADIIKIAMIRVSQRLWKEGLSARVVLQVHDELLVETPFDEISQVKEILQVEMAGAADLEVPLVVEVEEGENWYEAH